ncbi:MAG: DUF6516 family protein [Candidatus Tectimicrobiota bacterium]
MTIEAYVQAMKARFVTDPSVTHFTVMRERSTLVDGYLRARLALADGSQLEFAAYMQRSSTGAIAVITYGSYWADTRNQLITPWDNTPHFPGLSGFPDHIHDGATAEVSAGQPMSILTVLETVAGQRRYKGVGACSTTLAENSPTHRLRDQYVLETTGQHKASTPGVFTACAIASSRWCPSPPGETLFWLHQGQACAKRVAYI